MTRFLSDERDVHGRVHVRRSNVETTFSTIKRKFGDAVRSKTDVAMANEALCKVLCHNLVVLLHEVHELGIDRLFGQGWRLPKKSGFEGALWAKPAEGPSTWMTACPAIADAARNRRTMVAF
jgi:hypothetical protein